MTNKIRKIVMLVIVLVLVGWGIYRLMTPRVAQSDGIDSESAMLQK